MKHFLSLLPSLFKLAPFLFVISAISSILQAVFRGSIVIFNQHFFDTITSFTQNKIPLSMVIYALIALGIIHILHQVMNGISNFIPIKHKGIINRYLNFEFNKKMGKIAPIYFEDTNFLNDIDKAIKGQGEVSWTLNTFIFICFFYIPYFIFMSTYLFKLKPILVIAILLIFVPIALTQIIRTKIFANLEDKTAPLRRENEYYEKCIVGRDYFKETRLLGGFNFFINLYNDTLKIINRLRLKVDIKVNLIELSLKIFGLVGYVVIIFLLFNAVISKEISIGAFVAVFAGINDLYKIMEELIYSQIANMARDIGTIKNYTHFMKYKEYVKKDIELKKDSDIIVDNISFKYPNSNTEAIKNVSFKINKNETIAIVGENGSGKSTLIRLITGLYLPSKGNVIIGKGNKISAVFQKYNKYQMLLKHNINISDYKQKCTGKKLDIASDMAGFNKDEKCFDNGYDTMLSREFGGVDLSGGQWQRIAIARGFYRKHDLIVLDEPTAAIDPIEETLIYKRFIEMCTGKTAIIVTHRLGSVKIADRIIVMSKGKLIGNGIHEDLMNTVPEYAKMYLEQQKWYQ